MTEVDTKLAKRASAVFPGGVNSNVRLENSDVFFERGQGSRLWDVNGRDYVDYLLGQGPAFLGHAFEPVRRAVDDALKRGVVFGAQTDLEVLAGEAVLGAIKWADRLRFCMTGTEAVQAALRVARASTGKNKFVRFRGHYHGWLDDVLLDASTVPPRMPSAGQVPGSYDEAITLEWNDLQAIERAFAESNDIAAIMMEPMMLNAGAVLPAPEYLAGVRELCDRNGAVLIFDETITGFRIALGGGAELFDVRPDLAIYGKAMAGGYPAAALAGRAEIMDLFAGGTNHSGTFNANLPAVAAVQAAVSHMTENKTQDAVRSTGLTLQSGIRDLLDRHEVPAKVRGVGSAFHLAFGGPDVVRNYADLLLQESFQYRSLLPHLHAAGLWLAGRGIWYVSAAHDHRDVDETLDRLDTALGAFVKAQGAPID